MKGDDSAPVRLVLFEALEKLCCRFDWLPVVAMDDDLNGGLPARDDDWALISVDSLVNEVEKLSVSLEGADFSALASPKGGLLLASLYSVRPFVPKSLERLMASLWRQVYGVRMIEQGLDLLVFSFSSRIDMQRVLDEGSWR